MTLDEISLLSGQIDRLGDEVRDLGQRLSAVTERLAAAEAQRQATAELLGELRAALREHAAVEIETARKVDDLKTQIAGRKWTAGEMSAAAGLVGALAAGVAAIVGAITGAPVSISPQVARHLEAVELPENGPAAAEPTP